MKRIRETPQHAHPFLLHIPAMQSSQSGTGIRFQHQTRLPTGLSSVGLSSRAGETWSSAYKLGRGVQAWRRKERSPCLKL